ncbi:hypothetical protein EOD41_17845 [Mucilaginibacter limnophilus]|uniref:Uncharacterized protein n=1 Tax=Mucilaginibacter limnophilus TaxID=1932778 RepID=A0A3S2V030_9SPHI|nr:hypothetical protein [Mucilaginibacter limnophilus]RVT98235.1 hypothetical protein EOD41_17845 [Mucilaginibacter limnophilus]
MKAFEYALKMWQASVLLPPVVLAFYFTVTQYEAEPLSFILTAVVVGIIYSFPSFVIFAFMCYCLAGKNLTQVQQKSLLSFAGMALIVFAFNLFYDGILTHGVRQGYLGYVATYTCVLVAVIWCYKPDAVESSAVKDIGAL